MQHSAAHTMRLRSRATGTSDQAVENDTDNRPRVSVLGDISNRIGGVGGGDKGLDSKKPSTNKQSKSTKNIHFEDSSSNPAVNKPRRLSARLQQLREKENNKNLIQINDNSISQSNNHHDSKSSKASSNDSIHPAAATTLNDTEPKKRRTLLKNNATSTDQNKDPKRKRRRATDVVRKVLSRTKKARTSEELGPIVIDENIRSDEDEYVVHPDFRLQRSSFNRDVILGMAKHDRENKCRVLEAAPYVADMFQHHFSLEERTHPRAYMMRQADINSKMRAILVDWLVEVHMKFRLVPETLYLCINIIDRYCSQVKIKRAKLQLVGVTALLIACKYEEIYPPEVRDCVYITDSAYQRDEVLDMEQDIVHKLGFRITVPTAYPFLQRFLTILKASPIIKNAANYYTERTLQEHDLLCFRPSLICASAVVLAINNPDISEENKIDNKIACRSDDWPNMPPILLEYTGFTRSEIAECAEIIAKKVSEEPVTASRRQLVAVKRKYDNKKYLNVSTDLRLPSISCSTGSGNK